MIITSKILDKGLGPFVLKIQEDKLKSQKDQYRSKNVQKDNDQKDEQ